MSLHQLPEDLQLYIIDFLICDLQQEDKKHRKWLLTNDIGMACRLEFIYRSNKKVSMLLHQFWKMAIKQQFNLDDEWMKEYQTFIDEYFQGNMRRLFAGLCHASNSICKQEAKERRNRYMPTFSSSSFIPSLMTHYDCALISQDGCEKHRIVALLEGRSAPNDDLSDTDLVNSRTEVWVDFLIDFEMVEYKLNTLKESESAKFKSIFAICKSDSEESFEYMITGIKYCLELKKTYRIPCFVILNSTGNGPHLISKERIEQSLKDIRLTYFNVFDLTPETSSAIIAVHSEFTQDGFISSVNTQHDKEVLVQALEKNVKKKCLIQ